MLTLFGPRQSNSARSAPTTCSSSIPLFLGASCSVPSSVFYGLAVRSSSPVCVSLSVSAWNLRDGSLSSAASGNQRGACSPLSTLPLHSLAVCNGRATTISPMLRSVSTSRGSSNTTSSVAIPPGGVSTLTSSSPVSPSALPSRVLSSPLYSPSVL